MAEPTPPLRIEPSGPDELLGEHPPHTVWLARVSEDTAWVLLTRREAAFAACEAGWRVVVYTRWAVHG